MSPDVLWWLLCALLIVAGIAGTVLPALPGPILVLAGVALGAWIDGFTRVGMAVVAIVGVLAVLAWLLESLAGMMGAQKAGASREALIGAAIGTVAGIFAGFIGVLFLPLVGAAIGEYMAQRNHRQALTVGVATWIGLMAGMVAKVVIVFMMLGVFLTALVL